MIMLLCVKVSISCKVKSLRGSLSRGMATHLMKTCLEDGLHSGGSCAVHLSGN